MALKALLFLAACLAVASAGLLAPYAIAEDDGSYWPGKYDLRELNPALPSVPAGFRGFPIASYWG